MARLPIAERSSVAGQEINPVQARVGDFGLEALGAGLKAVDESEDAMAEAEAKRRALEVKESYEAEAAKDYEIYDGEPEFAKAQEEKLRTKIDEAKLGLSDRARGFYDGMMSEISPQYIGKAASLEGQYNGRIIAEQKQAVKTAQTNQTVLDFKIKSDLKLEADRAGAMADPDYEVKSANWWDEETKKIIDNAAEWQKADLTTSLSAAKTRYLLGIASDTAKNREEFVLRSAQDGLTLVQNTVSSDPSKLSFGLSEIDKIALTLPIDRRPDFVAGAKSGLYSVIGRQYIDKGDYEGLQDYLGRPDVKGGLSADAYAQFTSGATRGIESETRVILQAELTTQIANTEASVLETGQGSLPPQSDYVAAYGSIRGAALYAEHQKKITGLKKDYETLGLAAKASPIDWQKMVNESKPELGDPDYAEKVKRHEAMIAFGQKMQMQRMADPGAASSAIKDNQESFVAYQRGVDGAAKTWADRSITQQKIWGLRDDQIRILPKAQTSALVATVKNALPGKRFDAMAGLLAHVNSFGPQHEGRVLRELQNEGLEGKDAAVMVFAAERPQLLDAYARARDELSGKKIDAKEMAAVRLKVDKDVADWAKSYAVSASGRSYVNDMSDAITFIAQAAIQSGASPDMAVKAAAKTVKDYYVVSRYDGLRVPKAVYKQGETEGSTLQTGFIKTDNLIELGAEGLLKEITAKDGAGLYAPKRFPNLTEAENRKLYRDEVMSFGKWVANDDDSGARLMMPNGAGGWEVVRDSQQKPIARNWSQLMEKGKK